MQACAIPELYLSSDLKADVTLQDEWARTLWTVQRLFRARLFDSCHIYSKGLDVGEEPVSCHI